MDKILLTTEADYKNQSKYWDKNGSYEKYYFEDEKSPKEYPCIAIVTSYSVPDTYLTENTVSYVYLTDFKQ